MSLRTSEGESLRGSEESLLFKPFSSSLRFLVGSIGIGKRLLIMVEEEEERLNPDNLTLIWRSSQKVETETESEER